MSGIYFPTVLARLGIADAMKSKIVMPSPERRSATIVAKGGAEIGVQQISELLLVAVSTSSARCPRHCRRSRRFPPATPRLRRSPMPPRHW
jgi:hypothetical protein